MRAILAMIPDWMKAGIITATVIVGIIYGPGETVRAVLGW